jgi:hypothetical protein
MPFFRQKTHFFTQTKIVLTQTKIALILIQYICAVKKSCNVNKNLKKPLATMNIKLTAGKSAFLETHVNIRKPSCNLSRFRESRKNASGTVSQGRESRKNAFGEVSRFRKSMFYAFGRLSQRGDACLNQKRTNNSVNFFNL